VTVVEPEPAVASTLFGDRIDLARDYTTRLSDLGVELGLIGPSEIERVWTRHILNCVLLAPLLRRGRVGDIGSGAGLPGLVLAIARPDVDFTLVEPMERRVDWLRSETSRLALDNVEIVRGRAEDVRGVRGLDQLTARAVASLSRLVPIATPLVRRGGELLLMKGERVADELAAATKQVRKARLRDVEILVLGEGIVPEATRVFRATVD
jgi:16S rRNA (guanine527-N7)-methyltransferase